MICSGEIRKRRHGSATTSNQRTFFFFFPGVHQEVPKDRPPCCVRTARQRGHHLAHRGDKCPAGDHGEHNLDARRRLTLLWSETVHTVKVPLRAAGQRRFGAPPGTITHISTHHRPSAPQNACFVLYHPASTLTRTSSTWNTSTRCMVLHCMV